ncbi:MAG: glycosyltransferase [Candidatus Omnitrophica bacterium]|nr:glycosyltransferase [Candidatus Omnitrophota bacterium]MBD3268586.1 glycosyltransferase [Candidatus Omnitrophota bacterium]
MNILMMSNTYKPIIGGIEKSIEVFSRELRRRNHRVVIVAPEFRGFKDKEKDIIRVPAIQNFNGTDFSVKLPVPGMLADFFKTFEPDIVHSHHPFLIGDTALRISLGRDAPLVFTHHTMYEKNTHYVPGDSEILKKFVIELSTGYANLCDLVLTPSRSLKELLVKRGVKSEFKVVPTGIYLRELEGASPRKFREKYNIPAEAFVIGYLGRIAEEKNIMFLAEAVAEFTKGEEGIHFLIAGEGTELEKVKDFFSNHNMEDRFHSTGIVEGRDIRDAYAAMDVFGFSSDSETQGIVVLEAMAAGVPVVALEATGVRDVVRDKVNGCLVSGLKKSDFLDAFRYVYNLPAERRRQMGKEARSTAAGFSVDKSIEKLTLSYRRVREKKRKVDIKKNNSLSGIRQKIKAEIELAGNFGKALTTAFERTLPKNISGEYER